MILPRSLRRRLRRRLLERRVRWHKRVVRERETSYLSRALGDPGVVEWRDVMAARRRHRRAVADLDAFLELEARR